MVLLVLAVAVTNFALGYALAIYLGWARLPEFRKTLLLQEKPAAPNAPLH